jgi:hypothetical protein
MYQGAFLMRGLATVRAGQLGPHVDRIGPMRFGHGMGIHARMPV